MSTKTNNAISFLHKLLLISNYFCPSSIIYNDHKDTYERNSKYNRLKTFIFIFTCFVNAYCMNIAYNFRYSQKVFIVHLGALMYTWISITLYFIITVSNKKHENIMVEITNKLYRLQYEIENFKYNPTLEEVVTLGLIHLNILYQVIASYFYASYGSKEKFLENIGVNMIMFLTHTFMTIMHFLIEGRYCLMLSLVCNYLRHINDSFIKNSDKGFKKILKQHNKIKSLTNNINRCFSTIILFSIAIYFVVLVIRVISLIYYGISWRSDIFHYINIVGGALVCVKIFWLVQVSNQCMDQVNYLLFKCDKK